MELELSPHTISHTTRNNTSIATRVLKVVTIEQDITAVFDGLTGALTERKLEFKALNTTDFKFIPFQNHAIGRGGMSELMTIHNDFYTTPLSFLYMVDIVIKKMRMMG